jgi:hypothetical protein
MASFGLWLWGWIVAIGSIAIVALAIIGLFVWIGSALVAWKEKDRIRTTETNKRNIAAFARLNGQPPRTNH